MMILNYYTIFIISHMNGGDMAERKSFLKCKAGPGVSTLILTNRLNKPWL